MDLRKLRKFVRENNLTFKENTTETEREFIIEQKDSKYKLRALFTENNTKCKFSLENARNLIVEEYEADIENNDDMIKKVKDAVSLYDMIDTIDEGIAGDTFLSGTEKIEDLPNSIEDDNLDEELLIDQPQGDQDVELVEKTKKEADEDLEDELGIVGESDESKKISNNFAKKYAIQTNGGFVKLINNNLSYEIVENPESATYSTDEEGMKAKLINLAKSDIRPLKAGRIVDLNQLSEKAFKKGNKEGMEDKDIEVAGNKPSEISSNGSVSESLEVKIEETEEVEGKTIEEASKLINDALKIIKKLYNEETDGTIKTILGSIDLNIQIPQGQIDELKNLK